MEFEFVIDSDDSDVLEMEEEDDGRMGYADEEPEILNLEQLSARQWTFMAEVANLLAVSQPVAGLLLHHFGWSKERLRSEYFEDTERVLEQAGVVLGSPSGAQGVEEGAMCDICCDDLDEATGWGPPCGHVFCKSCWGDHLHSQIALGPSCLTTRCMMTDCPVALDYADVKNLAEGTDFAKYDKMFVNSFVDGSSTLRWCSNPESCGSAISYEGLSLAKIVRCSCGFDMCFSCGHEGHTPAKCEMVKEWSVKAESEAENTAWILANTKPCPKCSVNIEKNKGCMHMTCRTSGCGYEFCWLCRGPWSEHGSETGGYYKCNRYESSNARETDIQAEAIKSSHDRYLHYYNRYHNHGKSKDFAAEYLITIRDRMEEYQASKGWSPEFLMDAATLVMDCRQVLKWTYVFAYYLEDEGERNLFEFLQEDLEKNTEHLNSMTESSVDDIDPSSLKNYTRITRNFLNKLIEGTREGLTIHADD